MSNPTTIRQNWTVQEVQALFDLPFMDLLFQAQVTHRANFPTNEVQVSTLLSIKTGACPEDCKYCPQSARYDTGLEKERLMEIEKVISAAKDAKSTGSITLAKRCPSVANQEVVFSFGIAKQTPIKVRLDSLV